LSIVDPVHPDPALDYADAVRRFAALAARDGPQISSPGRSRFFGHRRRTERALVFIHGFTNCPQQWVLFASGVHAAGATVVIPRLPGHGHFDRATRAAARPSAAQVLETIHAAVDIARGAAERTILVGLSIGGTIGPSVALARDDIAHTVAMVPFFAVKGFDEARTRRLSALLQHLPNASVPWDPFGDGSQIPSYGYPKFSTKMLGRFLQIGSDVDTIASVRAPAGKTTFVLNAKEPATENPVTLAVCEKFERARSGSTQAVVWDDLPANHDIIDPTNPNARIDLVYPRLRAIVDGSL
jgi:carboxylesterase